jgi:hypothetical protein
VALSDKKSKSYKPFTDTLYCMIFILLRVLGRMGLQEICLEGVDWIYVAHDGDQWRAIMSIVMNLRVSLKAENFVKAG